MEKPRVGSDTRLNRAVRDLQQFDAWNCQAIDDRQAMLVQLAPHVWLSALEQIAEAS